MTPEEKFINAILGGDEVTPEFIASLLDQEHVKKRFETRQKNSKPITNDYPVNVYTYEDRMEFEINIAGLAHSSITVTSNKNELTVKHTPSKTEMAVDTVAQQNITIRKFNNMNFNYTWKISPTYNVADAKVYVENGLMNVKIWKQKNNIEPSRVHKIHTS